MKYLVLILVFLYSFNSLANDYSNEYFINFGLGVIRSADYEPAQVKVFSVGYRSFFWPGLYWSYKAGFWADSSPAYGRSGSAYAATGPGMKLDLQPFEMRAGWGLCAISSPDWYLGGRFPQFNGELYIGLRDAAGIGMGLQFEHISSAGIYKKNIGRDFMNLQLNMRWPF